MQDFHKIAGGLRDIGIALVQACTQAQVHAMLNDTEAVKMWVAPFPYAAILVSDLN